MKKSSPIPGGLIFTIVFVSSLLSSAIVLGALHLIPQIGPSVSSGTSAQNTDLAQEIEKGIERFVQKQQQEQEAAYSEQQQESEKLAQNVAAADKNKDHIRGNIDADITIIEYSDYECPFCKKNHPTVQQVIDNYDGKVNWVYRHLPLSFHLPHAQDQAEASECVAELEGNEAFWKFTDELYERTKSNKGFAYEQIQPLAEELGVDGSDFAACMESDRHLEVVQSHADQASSMGISGTPGNLIRNNKTGEVKLLGGAYPFEAFTQIIDTMLSES